MLPSALFTTFRQYKQDTQKITEWLAGTAKACGYERAVVAEKQGEVARPKSKNKKKKKTTQVDAGSSQNAPAPATKEYVVKTNEYVPMAQSIANAVDANVIIPLSILRAWKSCIVGRGTTAKWYETDADVKDQDSNVSHEYFIDVLKQALQVIVPIAKLQELDRNQFNLSKASTPVESTTEPSNRFAHLEIQDIDETAYEALPGASGTEGKTEKQKFKFVPEGIEALNEWYFALECFMDDMQLTQQQTKGYWEDYADGETDLVTAAVATNLAIELIKKAEEEFLKIERPDVIKDWGEVDLPMAWYGHACIRDGLRPSQPSGKYFVAMDTWEQAKESYLMLARMCTVYSNGTIPGLEGPNRVFALTRPAYYGTYNPELDFEELSDKKQYEQMGACLNDMLVTVGALAALAGTPCDDMLIQGIHHLQLNQINPPMWLLFACQNFLDIHFTLQTRSERPYEELRDFALATRRTLKQHQAFLRDNSLPRMRDRDDEEAVNEILEELETWVLNDEIKKVLSSIEQQGTTKKRRIWQDFEVFRMHPLLCGMVKYAFHTQLQLKGITLVNDTGIVTAAHLYNALQVNGYLGDKPAVWEDMEYLLDLHQAEDTFMGKRPKSIEDCTKRLALVQGVAPTTFARRRRGNNHRVLRSRNGSKFLKPSTPIAQILGLRYLTPLAPFDLHMEQLETVVGVVFDRDVQKFRIQDALLKEKIGHLDLSTEEGKHELLHAFPMPTFLDEEFCKKHNIPTTVIRIGTLRRKLKESIFEYDWKTRALEVLDQMVQEEKAKRGELEAKGDAPAQDDENWTDDDSDSMDPNANETRHVSEIPGAGDALRNIHERWQQSRTLPLDIFIDVVRDSLQAEYLDIQFDYFAFFRSAFSLMQKIQEEVKPLLEPCLSDGLVKERLKEPEGAVCVVPQMALLLACNPHEAPNIMALRNWLEVDTRALCTAAKVMLPWIEENGDKYCITESDREEKRTENLLKEGPKVQYFDNDEDEGAEAPVVRKAENRNAGWSSSLGMVEGLNAREMRQVYDAMKENTFEGPTVAETIARLQGTRLDDADRESAEANRALAREVNARKERGQEEESESLSSVDEKAD